MVNKVTYVGFRGGAIATIAPPLDPPLPGGLYICHQPLWFLTFSVFFFCSTWILPVKLWQFQNILKKTNTPISKNHHLV